MKILYALLLLICIPAFGQDITDEEKPVPIQVTDDFYQSNSLTHKPSYEDGMEAFYAYIGNNMKVPHIKGVTKLVIYAYFVVEKDGSMSNIKILRKVGYGLDEELERVLKSIPGKWSPGIIDGNPVRASFSLPVTVNMTKK